MDGENAFRDSLRSFSSGQNAGAFATRIGGFFSGAAETTQESLTGLLSGAQSTLQNAGITGRREENDADAWGLTRFQRFIAFGLCTAMGVFCLMIALFTLPLVVLSPQRFAATFTLGSFLLMSSYAMLRGPMTHLKHIFSYERLPFSLLYVGSLIGTLYFSIFAHSYIFSILFIILQIGALLWYNFSYFPGGTQRFISMCTWMFGGGRTVLPMTT